MIMIQSTASMFFPDQSHINQVRDALRKRPSRATVMVGAGFSKNASSIIPDAGCPPTLEDLRQVLFDELYTEDGQEFGAPINIAELSSDSRDFPSLSQEYENAFGRTRLNELITRLIGDGELKPTDLHKRLLKLPWRDVFTTNWDTLLEKSSDSVPECNYSVLQNKDQIPLSDQPRIIKLHGSLPAHFPLICTEEDYRTYPRKFAPFVKTVQQAMMETTFLLIGFSGDDPNFINWTGWVRDNLGESAPKIYLAGWLNLSVHRRRMLEQRNVVSIDLAHHPKAKQWPDHQRHNYAMQWILYTLECGQPYKATNWPLPRKSPDKSIPDQFQPIEKKNSDLPKEEPLPNSGEHRSTVDEIISIWTHNRKLYPGWIAVPGSVQQKIIDVTDQWEPIILEALPKFDPVRQLEILYELTWRREILLDPILKKFESVAEEVLQKIDCKARTINGESKKNVDWSSVRTNYRVVAFLLLSDARLSLDQNVFEERLERLQEFGDDNPDVAHRLHHERCLWAIYSMDYQSLTKLLNNWSLKDCDPIWMIRKAALLYETNRINEAYELSKKALSAIQKIPNDDRSVAGPSRVGWTLRLMVVLESIPTWMRPDQENSEQPFDSTIYEERRRELFSVKCDVLSDIKVYDDALEPKKKKDIAPSFDFGTKTTPGVELSNMQRAPFVTAYRAIRLSEVAGLPPSSFPTLKLAVDELSSLHTDLAVHLMLRTCDCDTDDLIKRVLSRPRITILSTELADKLIHLCNNVIRYTLPRIGSPHEGGRMRFWAERMRVAVEVLSRLLIRENSEKIEEFFNKALGYYTNTNIIQNVCLYKSVQNFLKRSWHSLPKHRQSERFLDLLSAPIFGIDNTVNGTFLLYPNPLELFVFGMSPPDRTDDTEDRWRKIVSELVRGLNKGGKARERVSHWIFQIVKWGNLREEEKKGIADALWNDGMLPEGIPLADWELMVLPEPEPGMAEQKFREKWLSVNAERANDLGPVKTLAQVGAAIWSLKVIGKPLILSGTEQDHLINVIYRWLDLPILDLGISFNRSIFDDHIKPVLDGISTILTEIKAPKDLAEKLNERMVELNDSGIPAFGFIPGLLTTLPNRLDKFSRIMRLGLTSHQEDVAKGAARTLHHWLTFTTGSNSNIPPPPDDLVQEIGVIIATRRIENLAFALGTAKKIFNNGTDAQREVIRDLALYGLKRLLDELGYDGVYFEQEDIPLLRWHCVQLALSMSKHGIENEPAIIHWSQKTTKTDPLPEIRFTVDSAS